MSIFQSTHLIFMCHFVKSWTYSLTFLTHNFYYFCYFAYFIYILQNIPFTSLMKQNLNLITISNYGLNLITVRYTIIPTNITPLQSTEFLFFLPL